MAERPAPGHLEQCDACAGFARRLAAIRQGLVEHRADIEPDAGFAGRVLARGTPGPTHHLGWAAARLLPIGVALALTLAWISWSVTSNGENGALSSGIPTEEPLSWALEENGEPS